MTSFRDFALISDVHVGHSTGAGITRFRDACAQIARANPSFLFINGDLYDVGISLTTAATKAQVNRILRQLPCPVFLAIGNHDIGGVASVTDCTPTLLNALYAACDESFVNDEKANTAAAEDVGYFKFYRDGVWFISINACEIEGDTEGSYELSSTQKTWLTDTLAAITGSTARILVFSHVDPSRDSGNTSVYYRLSDTDSAYVRGALEDWRTSTGGKVLGVFSGHEHGTQNSSMDRVANVNSIDYINLMDGLTPAGVSNVKTHAYETGDKLVWSLVSWNEILGKLSVRGQNGAGNHLLTPA